MVAFTLQVFLFALISSNFQGITATDTDPTTTDHPEEYLSDEVVDAIEIYKNFTDSVFGVLSALGENNTEEADEGDDGGSIASLLGISYILASTHEQVWPLSYPIFNEVMENTSFDVLEALDTVLDDIKETLSVTNALFTTPSLNTSTGTKNLLELIEVDFEEDDTTIPAINDNIFNFTNGLLQTNYIPDGILIPSSTLAVVINVVQTKSKWPSPLTPVGRKYFNKRELTNFLQFRGEVKYTEYNGEIELIMYFQNEKTGLALRMPKDIDEDRAVANIEKLPLVSATNVTIVIPELKYTLRSSYNLDDANHTNCNFRKEPNMLQILDVLTYVNLASDYFQIASVSGAQIVNVRQLIEEIRNQTDGVNKDDDSAETSAKTNTNSPRSSTDEPDTADADYEDGLQQQSSSESKLDNAMYKGKVPEDNEVVPEKVIIFNKPFTWMIFDNFVVPIVAGVVTTLKSPEDTSPPALTLLGTEGNKVSPYLQCYEGTYSSQ